MLSPFLTSESLKVGYFNNSVEINDGYLILVILWILASFVNLYFLYNFKKPGREMFLYIFIAGIILSLFGGPVAFDPLYYVMDGIGMSVSGALLFMLYFSKLKTKF